MLCPVLTVSVLSARCSSLKEKNFVWSRSTSLWRPHSKTSSAASRPLRRAPPAEPPSRASQTKWVKVSVIYWWMPRAKEPRSSRSECLKMKCCLFSLLFLTSVIGPRQSGGNCNNIKKAFYFSYINLWHELVFLWFQGYNLFKQTEFSNQKRVWGIFLKTKYVTETEHVLFHNKLETLQV